jgi:hypothetical protein
MNQTRIFDIAAVAAITLAVTSSGSRAEPKSLKDQLVGSWTLVSAATVKAGGNRTRC